MPKHFSICIILLLAVATCPLSFGVACTDTAEPTQTPEPTEPPPAVSQTASFQQTDIQLHFPATITYDDVFLVDVSNEGTGAYVYYVHHPSNNCLSIVNAKREFMQTIPGETCDALAEIIIAPGQKQLFSSWDLKRCTDLECLTREFVPPGRYYFSATFYPYTENSSITVEDSFTFEQTFTVLPPPE